MDTNNKKGDVRTVTNEKYLYRCERCNERIVLEAPVEHHPFRVHESCPNHELVPIIIGDYNNLMVEMNYLGKDVNYFLSTGIVIARLELSDRNITLETNGEEGDMYLEIVEYKKVEQGVYVETSFSDPIYEVPKTLKEVEEYFKDWLEVDELVRN